MNGLMAIQMKFQASSTNKRFSGKPEYDIVRSAAESSFYQQKKF